MNRENKRIEVYKHSLWAKWLFLPVYTLWIGWLYILGAEIEVKFTTNGKTWKLV